MSNANNNNNNNNNDSPSSAAEKEQQYRLLGGDPVEGDIDFAAQVRLTELLKEWGSSVASDEARSKAREEVAEHSESNKGAELFVFNPYRPQGGMGFPGTAMWTSLLSELPSSLTEEQKKKMAEILRVDQEHNSKIHSVLAKQDQKTNIVKQEIIAKANSVTSS